MLIRSRSTRFFLFLIISLLFLNACSDDTDPGPTEIVSVDDSYIETGDLDAISSHEKLRILSLPEEHTWLPRQGTSFESEQDAAIKLARSLDLQPVFVYVKKFEELVPALQQGRGDIIAANLTITESRKDSISFSVPLLHSRERIVARKDDALQQLNGLKHRTIAYLADTSHEETIQQLQQQMPSIKTQVLDGDLNEDQILDLLNQRKIDLTILDANRLDIISSYRSDFSSPLALTEERAIAWAVRKDNPRLLEHINQFLTQQQLTDKPQSIYRDDLDKIKQRKTLRVITRNNAASYFLWRGELLGFEYELAKKFAAQHGLRVEIIVAPSHEEQIPMLLRGEGDIIANFMTITDQRKQQGIVFSRPHHQSFEVVVTRSDDNSINSINDLSGRTFHVRESSAYWHSLQKLKREGHDFNIEKVDENMETEEIIAKVASGEFDLTLADEHLLNIELTWRDDVKRALPLGEERDHAWVVRSNNPQLLDAANRFIKKQYRSLFYNVTYNKYFKNPHRIKEYRDDRLDLRTDGGLSPYDELVKKYAREHQFDWRLLTAQMYQESRFNPKAKSWVGARGLMQVMPRTAKELGIENLQQPENGIKAGVLYLNWVRERFEEELDVKDRMWFTLAAYNAGQGHVKDARRLAAQLGLNPDRWFDNVEKAMLLLSKPQHARKARHGYVRGSEPVNYVRGISKRYYAYLELGAD